MSKISELNKLAEKVTGTNPQENTIKEILDEISSSLSGKTIRSANITSAIKNLTDSYSGGGGGGGGTATKPVVPGSTGSYENNLGPLVFLYGGSTNIADVDDNVLDFYESLDFSEVVMFSSMFANSSWLTRGPVMDTSSGQSFNEMFKNCERLESIPQYDFSNGIGAIGMSEAFYGCSNLESVPNLITKQSDAMYLENMFYGCDSLSNESLNNIMAMCANCPLSEYKELSYLGISEDQAAICEGLSNYNALLAAGWTTGYDPVN